MINLRRSLKELELLVQNSHSSRSVEEDAALARFLVVRTCGYVEQVIEECCKAYLRSKADGRCAAFGSSWFGRGRNPTPDYLIELMRRFDVSWGEDLEKLLEDDDQLLRRQLGFLVDRRNKIAHGLSENVGVRKALDLVPIAESVVGWFIERLDPR